MSKLYQWDSKITRAKMAQVGEKTAQVAHNGTE
jgi:hypothetical protein